MKKEGVANGQSGAVVVVQRTSSDLKTNPHLHVLFLDGVYCLTSTTSPHQRQLHFPIDLLA
jgi:hypothetical protein